MLKRLAFGLIALMLMLSSSLYSQTAQTPLPAAKAVTLDTMIKQAIAPSDGSLATESPKTESIEPTATETSAEPSSIFATVAENTTEATPAAANVEPETSKTVEKVEERIEEKQELAQAEVPPAPKERKVDSIALKFKGVAAVSEAFIRSHIELKAGDVFTQAALDRSVRSLFGTGYFDNVYATPVETAPGLITITVELSCKLKLRAINFEGNHKLKSKKLKKEVGLKLNSVLGADDMAEAVRKLKSYYAKKNFPDVKIVTRTTPMEQSGLVDLTFVIDEGKKQKVKAIYFVGNTHAKRKELTEIMATKKDSWLSFITGSGKLDDDNTSDDLTRIGEYYRNLGFLEVKVNGPQVTPRGDGVTLTYNIVEGKRFYIGNQIFEGNKVLTAKELSKALLLKEKQPLSAGSLDKTSENIRSLYGSKGYLEAQTHVDMLPTQNPNVLDVKYNIQEGKQFSVSSINVSGNTTTKSIVVTRELLLAPGDTFASTKMKTSEERLKNTGYFEDVKIAADTPASGDDSQRDMNVNVSEGKTGKVSFGAGFSSLDKATLFAELTQGNFDAFNFKNGFRGGGQKLRLYGSIGEKSNQAILNFEEPWLFQRRVAGGFSLYHAQTDYLSSKYNERRQGFEVYLRKRLVELVDGRLGYRRENVDLFGVSDDASPAIKAEAGSRSVSKVTFDLTRDTRDRLIFPTRGNRLELNTAWAGNGLGGQTDYWLVEARGAKYFRSFNWPTPQTITLLGRAGTMNSFSDNGQVPLFDRFFLGGPDSLRGFSYRKIGPTDSTGEPLGGKTYEFFSFEYAFQVAKPVQLVTFYDWGVLNGPSAAFNPNNYNDNYGIGIRILLYGAPLRLDYGVPITSSQYNKNSGRFWFSFGTRF